MNVSNNLINVDVAIESQPVISPSTSKIYELAKTIFGYINQFGQALFFVAIGLKDLIIQKIKPLPDCFSDKLKDFKNPLFGKKATNFFDTSAYPMIKGALFLTSGVSALGNCIHQSVGGKSKVISAATSIGAASTFAIANFLLFLQYCRLLFQSLFLLKRASAEEKEFLDKVFAASITGIASTCCYIVSSLTAFFPPLTVVTILLGAIGIMGDSIQYILNYFSSLAEKKLLSH